MYPSILISQSFRLLAFGDVDGLLVTNVTGGTPFPGPHYQYTLNGVLQSQISGIFQGLGAGGYDLIVHDNNGCEDTLSFQVVEPDDIETDLSQNSISCFGGSDGAVTAVTIGGTLIIFLISLQRLKRQHQAQALFQSSNRNGTPSCYRR